MAYFPFLQKSLLSLFLSSALVACSADSLMPPSSVGSTHVSSIQPRRVSPAIAPQRQYAYSSNTAPVRSASVDFLDTPNLAGLGHAPGSRQPVAPQAMESASSQSAPPVNAGENVAFASGSRQTPIPSQGVNMDAGLGVEPAGGQGAEGQSASDQAVIGLAQEEEQNIAEGNSDEPVVDGIGTDDPTQTNGPTRANQRALPRSVMQAQISQNRAWQQGQQVAMLPRAQNPMLAPEPDTAPQSTPAMPGMMPASELQCRQELKRMGVVFEDKPPISNGPSCQVPYPVSLRGLSGDIAVKPAVTLNCQVTLAFAKWVKNELAPAARTRYWSGVGTIIPLGGYSCRRMNNSSQRYNPMSEHAHGNAIDVGKFVLKNGHEIDIRKKGLFSFREGALLKAVRSDSCRYFDTVLGPGSNPEHWNHFHFDLRERHGGRRYCSL
ncbi:extensin family protein [Rhizobium tubonense]|uniref:Extensin n=1 Tax=Rhizobium tubonense TaxID=484088 RepID=A0A2W4CQT2_9HYPH|nr:extensin family protein [Rhizobium tubonense]PZM13228.1 extensin [Rhizobium tubonense]